ncbi:hypothetical protein GCM10027447_25800 [Glycomyces halotolerans]
MSLLLWALPGLPLAAGAALLVSGRRADRRAPAAAVTVAAALVPIAAVAAAARPAIRAPMLAGLPVELAVDGLSALMVVTVAVVALAVLVYSLAEFGTDEARARYYGLMLVFTGAMMATVTAASLLPLLMAWEIMGAASYALIGFWWREPWRIGAATTAFLTTRAADLGLYLAAGAAFAASGSLALDQLAALPEPWLDAVTAGVLLAAAGKSAQLPFSFWLSGAMAGPSPVSALLHSAAMVAAGGYLLLRLSPMLHASGWGAATAAWLGAATALVLGAIACAQTDLKQLLAASTSAQVGFMVLAAGAGSAAGGAAHLAGHAAVKSLLFLAAGAWLAVLGTKDLDRLRGAGRRHRPTGAAFTIGALALAGVPPLTLWATEGLALAGAPTALHVVALAASALSAVYAGRILFTAMAPSTEQHRPVPTAMVAATAALAVPAAGFGAAALWWPAPLPPLEPVGAAASAVIAVAALAAAALWTRRGSPLPEAVASAGRRWLWLEPSARRVIARPVWSLARTLAAFDDRVLAAGARGAARGGRAIATAVDDVPERRLTAGASALGRGWRTVAALVERAPERAIKALVDTVANGGGRLGALARRPQTGQLHQYFAQAAVAFAVLVLVFVLMVR